MVSIKLARASESKSTCLSVSPPKRATPPLLSNSSLSPQQPHLKVLDAERKSPIRETLRMERLISKRFSELAREKMWSRIHLIPLLTAEEDRDLVRRHWADIAREKELLGSETKVYNGTRYDPISSLHKYHSCLFTQLVTMGRIANYSIYVGLCGLHTQ